MFPLRLLKSEDPHLPEIPRAQLSGRRVIFFFNIATDGPGLFNLSTVASYKFLTSHAYSTSLQDSLQPTQLVPISNQYFGSWLTDTILMPDSGMTGGLFLYLWE